MSHVEVRETRSRSPFALAGPPRSPRAALESGRGSLVSRLMRVGATRELLDRYLPDAVRQHLQRGVPLDRGEREVTVLFVDLHGFTGFAEPLSAPQVFEVLSAYTRTVTRQVGRHQGTVIFTPHW